MLKDTMQRPRILLVSPQGIPVPTNVPHQHSYCFNRIGLCRTVPSQFIATYLKGLPRSGLGSIVTPKHKPLKVKQPKQTREAIMMN